jgi:putative Mg2+ transporter-C (MgtC) family protein
MTELGSVVTQLHSLTDLIQYFGPKLFFGILCGGIIGLERELKNKAAGIKTNILICVGASVFTSASVLLAGATVGAGGVPGDPSRIAAQIVSGVGFLGGGAIIQSRGTILGLTTAATIWVVAAIGVLVGTGYSLVALTISVGVVLILVASNLFEDKVLGRSLTFVCQVLIQDSSGDARQGIHQALASHDLVLDDFEMETRDGAIEIQMRYTGHRLDHRKFVLELWGIPGIREVRQL